MGRNSLSLPVKVYFHRHHHHQTTTATTTTTERKQNSSRSFPSFAKKKSNDETKNDDSNKKSFTRDDVAKHNRSNDCWVIVHDRAYDVTKFVPKHPGGNMIHVNAGGECTALFESYHPLKARKVLEKFYVGDVVGDEEKEEEDERGARRRTTSISTTTTSTKEKKTVKI